LETFGEVWPQGKEVLQQVKTIARELLRLTPGQQPARPLDNWSSHTPKNEAFEALGEKLLANTDYPMPLEVFDFFGEGFTSAAATFDVGNDTMCTEGSSMAL
jgi:hypothetical protein